MAGSGRRRPPLPWSRPRETVLRGRALVTGGTSGIGLAFAHALAARGCDLVLVARDAERLGRTADALRARHRVDVETLRADLVDRADVAAVAARLEDAASPVGVLVNNAGTGMRTSLLAEDTTEHDRALEVMVRTVLVLGGAAGRAMRARGSGVVVNVASVAALTPMGGYSAVKAWVATYSESLALELAGTGVRVLTLMPGWVRTEFHERAGIRTGSIPGVLWLRADRVAEDCLRDVERGRDRSVPSLRFTVLAFLARHAPRPLVRRATAVIKGTRS